MPQRLVLIHTGKCADKGPFDKTHSKLPPLTGKEPLGCLLGVIVLDGPYKREDHPEIKTNPYANGNYCYKIIKRVCLTKTIPSKGQLGLYKVQEEKTLHQLLKDENIIKHIQSINDMLSRIHPTISNHWTMENLHQTATCRMDIASRERHRKSNHKNFQPLMETPINIS